MMEITIHKNPRNHGSNSFHIDNGDKRGFGYISKKGPGIGLIRCPDCEKENYAMNVPGGVCTWCNFDVKPLIQKQ